jgi:ABC-2 type transport system ATP-binding protein
VAKQGDRARGSISLTGQFAAVDNLLTGRENLLLIGQLRHSPDPAGTAQMLLEQFGLIEAADRRTLTYSGGMRRKLDIALGLIGDPAIIFLDEPTAGLDPESRNMTWDTIKALTEVGKTVFLTTQYLEEADRLADDIGIISHGRIAARGTPRELKGVLPQGQIELRFAGPAQLARAAQVLGESRPTRSDSALTLTVSTDGTIAQVKRLFGLLETAELDVAEFSQKSPTLDDAFLRIIGNQKGAA